MYDTTWAESAVGAWPSAPTLVAPGPCGRCGGTGNVGYGRRTHMGEIGCCFDCHGHGQVETDEATIAATKAVAKEARRQERRMEKLRAWEATQRREDGTFTEAQHGLWRLQNSWNWTAWNAAVDTIVAGADLAGVEAQLAVSP